MNRIIPHVLHKTGYFGVFVGFAYVISRNITNQGSDKRAPTLFHEWMSWLTLFLVFGYGAFLHGKISSRWLPWLWISSTILFLDGARFLRFYGHLHWDDVRGTFVPKLHWDYVLEAIGSFYPYVVDYWMPAAGCLSLVALVLSLHDLFIASTHRRAE